MDFCGKCNFMGCVFINNILVIYLFNIIFIYKEIFENLCLMINEVSVVFLRMKLILIKN